MAKVRPSRKWYLLPLLLFILGPLFAAYLLISVFSAPKHSISFYVPGTAQILIPKAGHYTLWIETKRPFNGDKLPSGLQESIITFTDVASQKSFQLAPEIGWSSQEDHKAHYSLGSVDFSTAGNYQVIAQGAIARPYKVYFRQPSLPRTLRALAASIAVTLLSLITAFILAIIILIKRIVGRNTMAASDNKIPPSAEPAPDSKIPPPVEPTADLTTPTQEETNWAMVCHLSGFAGFLFPLANIIAPLLIWGFKRHTLPFLDEQGKEAINFQISVSIYYVISLILIVLIIGLFLLPLLAAFQIIAMIIASIEVSSGKHFRYPLTIRFIK